jgi:predicted ATPase/DNA-binding SARP family transcriptional activator
MAARGRDTTTIDIRLLGGVRACTPDGGAVDVGPAKCQVVLATLALSVGATVPVPRLVEAVWGEEPPRTAERTLQAYLARLRGVLGADAITRSSGSYRLDVPREAVDVARFERSLEVGDLDAALAQWAGEPLAGLEAPGLRAALVGLTERWLAAVEQSLEQRVESDPAGCIAPLTELTATHPFREGLWALLMTALYRVGRQADALAAYRTAQGRLADALGVEPGSRLRDLELRILRHDRGLGASSPTRPAGGTPALPTGTVTFAFVDVEDAARLWADDATRMAAVLVRHHEQVLRLADRHRGHVFASMGDSHAVAFGTAMQASTWARQLLAAEPFTVAGHKVRLRLGLHTGDAEEHGGVYFGPAVNAASRLAGAGHGGQALVSGSTAALLDTASLDAELLDLGRTALDGTSIELGVFQLGAGRYPPLRTEDRHRGNLPRRLGRLVGRNGELERVCGALAAHRVVTLVGAGGIGKTALALAAAREHAARDGWLVELARIGSARDVPSAVAEVLGVTERHGAGLACSLVESLRARRVLLVLDNCEHVVEEVADLATLVTGGCPQAQILATSRERLGLTDERVVTVPPLDAEGSATLFAERARALDPSFEAGAHQAALAQICARLDGIPLAIELAAARAATLGPGDLLERLRHRMHVLDGTRRTGPDRHRTLWSAIRWSYDLLAPDERTVFRRLAVFTGPFDLAAAESVAAATTDELEVANALGRLTEQSLVLVESGPFGRAFRLLEPIREFGCERLVEAENLELVAERHARWCRSQVVRIHALLAGQDEHEGVARLTALWPNLRSAVHWACRTHRPDVARDLITPVLSEIVVRSANELGDWAERLLEVTPLDDTEGRVLALCAAAHRYSMTQDPQGYEHLVTRYGEPDHVLVHHARAIATEDYPLMAQWAPRAVEEFRARGDDHLAERAEINVATAWLNLGELPRADARLGELIARYRRDGPPTFLNWTLLLRGYSALFQEDKEQADRCFAEGVDIDVPPRTHTPSEPLKARAAFGRGEHQRAFRILRDHIDELLVTDNMQAGMMDCVEFVAMMASLGRADDAAPVLDHLESGHLLDGPGWRLLVADPADVVARERTPASHAASVVDDRDALEFMHEVLDRLVEG